MRNQLNLLDVKELGLHIKYNKNRKHRKTKKHRKTQKNKKTQKEKQKIFLFDLLFF